MSTPGPRTDPLRYLPLPHMLHVRPAPLSVLVRKLSNRWHRRLVAAVAPVLATNEEPTALGRPQSGAADQHDVAGAPQPELGALPPPADEQER